MEPDSKRKVSRGRGTQAQLTTLAIGLSTLSHPKGTTDEVLIDVVA